MKKIKLSDILVSEEYKLVREGLSEKLTFELRSK